MPAPIGEIWLAGANGDCSQAGSCADGPCGPGENTLGDCPDWEHEQVLAVSYSGPGHSVLIGGRSFSLGETVSFLRPPSLFEPRQYSYPFEVERTKDPTIPGLAGDFLPGIWTGLPGSGWANINLYHSGGGVYADAGGTSQRFHTTGTYAGLKGENTSFFQPNPYPYFWRISSSGILQQAPRLHNGVYPGTATGPFVDTWSKASPIITVDVTWRVVCVPGQFVCYSNSYSAIPALGTTPDEGTLLFGATAIYDVLTLNALPAAAGSGTLGVKLTSACEDPPP